MDEPLERRIGELLDRGELELVATEAVRGYGPAVYRFLISRTDSDDGAGEAFAQMTEDLWRGLPAFRRRCSFMTWMFALARNAAYRHEREPFERRRRVATTSALEAVSAEVRSRTAPYLRTDVKERFRAIRESLTPDERTLLHLRIDEELGWEEVARILDGDEGLAGEPLRRASARVRKQFSHLRRRLRERAEAEGLLDDGDE